MGLPAKNLGQPEEHMGMLSMYVCVRVSLWLYLVMGM